LKTARVVAGGLHQIVPEFLTQAYTLLVRGTAADGSALDLRITPVRGHCAACGWTGEVDVPFFQCARCESLSIDVVQGKELYLESLEVETDGN
jgi:hydrogenase nickel incorporation protein HypA/HybF